MNVADEHARVTQDVLLHQKYGVVNLTWGAEDADDGVIHGVAEQQNRGTAHITRCLDACSVEANDETNGILGDGVFATLLRTEGGSLAADGKWQNDGRQRLRRFGVVHWRPRRWL